ncbi:MAG: glycoside hydrolase family 3 N-terminal domain-containing protein, partial [Eubacterium sp.]
MINLREKPYYLDDAAIDWVEKTIDEMTLEEKIGQLFVVMVKGNSMERSEIKAMLERVKPAAMRYPGQPAQNLWEQNAFCQANSKIPLLIASNCEAGGNGGVGGGTLVANGAAIAAIDDETVAYAVGRIGATEAAAIGCNWNFAPVVDLLYNWRNSIVQTRSIATTPERTVDYAKAWNRATREVGLADCVKHFPGDGCDENDQHLCLTVNDKDADEWMATYGKMFKGIIDDGVKTIMAGHIAQPAWQRRLSDHEVADRDILPATLCPELINGLLKTELGFNGLVVTDASHMIGLTADMPRSKAVPQSIAAGCDLFLFMNDVEEDFDYMMEGYKKGIITEERLSDALHRILGLKASIGLHQKQADGTLMSSEEGLSVVGNDAHMAMAKECADRAITLVKDTRGNLPITPKTHPKLQLVFIGGDKTVVAGEVMESSSTACLKNLVDALERKGFEVNVEDGRECSKSMHTSVKKLKEDFDAVLVAVDNVGLCQYNTTRIKWENQAHQPWYNAELPTVYVSFNLPNSLIDLSMSRTYINAY